MDKSFTFLKGKKCSKSASVFEALGDLDELNVTLGLARAFAKKNLKQKILLLQNDLIEIGGFLSGAKKVNLKEKTTFLEEKIKQMTNSSVKSFSRPGANKTSAFLHLARAVCRRMERKVIGLKKKNLKPLEAYLNSLSNFLFWLAKKEEKIL
jgi:cob(I)alamin adenosyltransferase